VTTELKPVAFGSFGGLRLDMPIDEVPATNAIDCLDVDWEGGTDGALRPRDGATKFNAAEAAFAIGGLWRHSDSQLLAVTLRGGEYSLLVYAPDGSATSHNIGPAAATTVSYASLGTPSHSYTYFAHWPTTPLRWDGTNLVEPEATVDGNPEHLMPIAKYIAAWPAGGDRLIFANTAASSGPAGIASSPSHVWFSEAEGNAESFESTAYLQLGVGDGEEITGMVVWNGQVFIFKRTKFFRVYGIRVDEEGRPIFEYTEVALPSPHFGGTSNGGQRVVATANGVYFICQDGVYVTTGSTPGKVSDALSALDTPRAIPGPAATTFGATRWLDFAQLYYFRSRLCLVSPTMTLVFNTERGEWLPWKTTLTSMAPWNANSGGPDYLFFTEGKNVYKFDPTATADASVTMEPYWQSGFYDLGNEDEKVLVETKAWGSGEIGLEVFSDLSETPDAPSSDTLKFLPLTQALGQARSHKSQRAATLFSHKLTFKPGSRIQRLVRYLEVTLTPTTKSR
jgi:hypothetical protein